MIHCLYTMLLVASGILIRNYAATRLNYFVTLMKTEVLEFTDTALIIYRKKISLNWHINFINRALSLTCSLILQPTTGCIAPNLFTKPLKKLRKIQSRLVPPH